MAVARYQGSPPATDLITVNGLSGNDTIRVTQSGTTLTVTNNGRVSTFSTIGKTRLVINGLAGNDTLTVASNVTLNAFLYGGTGNDRLHGGAGHDQLFGGAGTDTADFSDATIGLSVSLDELANDGPGGADNVHGDVENVLGGSGADTLVGSALPNLLVGNGGDDTLRGGAGRDTLIGGNGKDKLFGDADDDLLIGSRTTYDGNLPFLLTIRFEWFNPRGRMRTGWRGCGPACRREDRRDDGAE